MISIITEICVGHRCETQTIRVNSARCNCHQLGQLAQQSTETPKLLKGHRRRTAGRGADGWQPKSPYNSIWQGKPACSGRPEVQPRLPGPQ